MSFFQQGILGREIVYTLSKTPNQWPTVHALSRSQKEQYPTNVRHNTVDLTQDASSIAKQLEGVEAEYLCTYVPSPWSPCGPLEANGILDLI